MNERLIAGDNRSRQNLNNQQEISSNNNDVILEDLIDMKKTNKVPMSYYRKVFILLGTGILFAAAIYSTTSFFSYATRPVGFRKNASVHGKDTYTWSKSFSQEEEEEEEEGIAFVFNQSPESSSKDVTFHEVGQKLVSAVVSPTLTLRERRKVIQHAMHQMNNIVFVILPSGGKKSFFLFQKHQQ